jgi:hypothetical protein
MDIAVGIAEHEQVVVLQDMNAGEVRRPNNGRWSAVTIGRKDVLGRPR